MSPSTWSSRSEYWLTDGRLITADGVMSGAVCVAGSWIREIRPAPPRGSRRVSLRGAFLSPGFIDLHVWGSPEDLSRDVVKEGTTSFLASLAPASRAVLHEQVSRRWKPVSHGAECLGLHLEGPYINPVRGGALPKAAMRAPALEEAKHLGKAGGGRIKLMTLAPELPGAPELIRWCRRAGIVASIGHTEAGWDDGVAAVESGARAVTHVFNAMRTFHHRKPGLVDVALTDPRLTVMTIPDGIHVSPTAFRVLIQAKGPERVALVTDNIKRSGWPIRARRGAYFLPDGTLAGSALTMMQAVANVVRFAGLSLEHAVEMASSVPARLLDISDQRGYLRPEHRADLVAFTEKFSVVLTIVGGRVAYSRLAASKR